MNSKFLRVRKSENVNMGRTSMLTEQLRKNNYIYFDFSDENKQLVKVLEELTELIGDNQIAGISNLSKKTQNMLHYLSDSKIITEQRRHIDEIVRTRIFKQKEELRRKYEQKKGRKDLSYFKKDEKGRDLRMSLDLPELENYLQNRESDEAQKKLVKKQETLFKSVSNAGQYVPVKQQRKKEKVNLVLPHINKIRYKKSRA